MKWDKPQDVTKFDVVFGPKRIETLLPAMNEIPAEFHEFNNPWQKIVSGWFFSGLNPIPSAKEGIDQNKALAHIASVLGSFEPKHEHKSAGCAYLMSLWFELPKEVTT